MSLELCLLPWVFRCVLRCISKSVCIYIYLQVLFYSGFLAQDARNGNSMEMGSVRLLWVATCLGEAGGRLRPSAEFLVRVFL